MQAAEGTSSAADATISAEAQEQGNMTNWEAGEREGDAAEAGVVVVEGALDTEIPTKEEDLSMSPTTTNEEKASLAAVATWERVISQLQAVPKTMAGQALRPRRGAEELQVGECWKMRVIFASVASRSGIFSIRFDHFCESLFIRQQFFLGKWTGIAVTSDLSRRSRCL